MILLLLVTATTGWFLRKAAARFRGIPAGAAFVLAITVVVVPMTAPYNHVLLLPAILLIVRSWKSIWGMGGLTRFSAASRHGCLLLAVGGVAGAGAGYPGTAGNDRAASLVRPIMDEPGHSAGDPSLVICSVSALSKHRRVYNREFHGCGAFRRGVSLVISRFGVTGDVTGSLAAHHPAGGVATSLLLALPARTG